MQFPHHPEWQRVLTDILAAAKAAGPGGVIAFDIDSTLLDNRPRQARWEQRCRPASHGFSRTARSDAPARTRRTPRWTSG